VRVDRAASALDLLDDGLPPPTKWQVFFCAELCGAVQSRGREGMPADAWPPELGPDATDLKDMVDRGLLASAVGYGGCGGAGTSGSPPLKHALSRLRCWNGWNAWRQIVQPMRSLRPTSVSAAGSTPSHGVGHVCPLRVSSHVEPRPEKPRPQSPSMLCARCVGCTWSVTRRAVSGRSPQRGESACRACTKGSRVRYVSAIREQCRRRWLRCRYVRGLTRGGSTGSWRRPRCLLGCAPTG
jgi:hypothetical protein